MGKYKTQSLNTKKRIAESLKKQMMTQSFNKISVTDIIKDCKINRNSFYYHFIDIYDLLQWTFEQEAINVIKAISLLDDIEEAVNFGLDYIDENRKICECVYDSLGRMKLKNFLEKDFIDIIKTLVDITIKENNYKISDSYRKFLIQNYSELLASGLIRYIKKEDNIERTKLTTYIVTMFNSSLKASLESGHVNNL